MRTVDVRSIQTIFSDHFRIDEARLRYQRPNGEMSEVVRLLSFERGDSAAAVVVDEAGVNAIVTRQFRFPTLANGTGWVMELVAGSIEENEAPEECIRREIMEELGYETLSLDHVSTFYTSPGGSSERIHLFHAVVNPRRRAGAGGGNPEEHEDIEPVEIPIAELPSLLASGSIMDAKTIIGFGWLTRAADDGGS